MRTIPYNHAPLCLLFAALCAGNIQAQTVLRPPTASQVPATPGSGTARVSGRVLSTLGAPIPKATVRLIGQAGQQGLAVSQSFLEISGSDGSFTFDALPEGRYSATAQKTGYTTDPNSSGPLNQITISAGETKQNFEIKLSPLGIISGRITDRDGDPIANVQVRLMRYGSQQGRTILQQQNSGNSDDRGQYRIVNVNPGRYYLAAEDPSSRIVYGGQQLEVRGLSAQNSNLTTYYPSSTDTRNATRLDVKAGMQFDGVDIRMSRGQSFTVKGVVTDSSGTPIQAQVTVNARDGMAPPAIGLQASSAPGTGIFNLPAISSGDYVVTVRSTVIARPTPVTAGGVQSGSPPGQPQPVLFGRFDLSVRGANIEGLQLQLVPGPTVTGHVIVDGGGELTQMGVNIVNGTPTQVKRPLNITLVDADMNNGASTGQLQTDGTFTISNVTPSRYALNTGGLPQQYYVKSIRMGGQDVTNQYLDFRSGSSSSLEIRMGTKPGKISGPLLNSKGEPAANAPILLWPKTLRLSDANGNLRSGRTNATGGFTLANVPPGEYYIAAFEDLTQEYLRLPDFLTRFNPTAKTVKLEEDGNETVEPKWITREASDKEAASFPD